ncbi:MAG: hypothetical protein AAFP93_02930 [Bacteroidota bacterium]
MYVPYDQLPATTRTWIYQAGRPLADYERKAILVSAESFVNNWSSHGQSLRGSVAMLADRFLIIGVDESYKAVSGCAYDTSLKFVETLEQSIEIPLLDRSQIAFRNKQAKIYTVPLSEIQENMANSRIAAEDDIFDTSLTTKKEIENKFPMPIMNSWASRYL